MSKAPFVDRDVPIGPKVLYGARIPPVAVKFAISKAHYFGPKIET